MLGRGPNDRGLSRRHIKLLAVEDSLRRLGTDRFPLMDARFAQYRRVSSGSKPGYAVGAFRFVPYDFVDYLFPARMVKIRTEAGCPNNAEA